MENRPLHSSLGDVSFGLPQEAVPVSKVECGAVASLAFEVRFGSRTDMRAGVTDVRFTPESGHTVGCTKCPLSAKSGHQETGEKGAPIAQCS